MKKKYLYNVIKKLLLIFIVINSCVLSKTENYPEDITKIVTPHATYATVLVSTLPSGTGTLPVYLNKNIDNGKLVSSGTTLTNKICPWKIGGLPNPKTGAFTPLPRGTKLSSLSADNYYPDPTGITAFCGNVSVAGDLTVTGTLNSSTGQFCVPSDIGLNPVNTLLVNT